ncbi:hypothetical protein [Fastidiosibacter lacustris]|uniref:hypothetical protein n=1 Tax=Fastidiosibacter lacustris TaxID=2056695 RepID=UPI000E354695|nr:hypothetical protein [Fastidiosibacter lacustris]
MHHYSESEVINYFNQLSYAKKQKFLQVAENVYIQKELNYISFLCQIANITAEKRDINLILKLAANHFLKVVDSESTTIISYVMPDNMHYFAKYLHKGR